MDYQRHASITGAVTVAISPAATLDYTRHAGIVGSVPITLTPAAVLEYTTVSGIIGAVPITITPSGVQDYQRHASIVGTTTITIGVAGVLQYTGTTGIVGAVTIYIVPTSFVALAPNQKAVYITSSPLPAGDLTFVINYITGSGWLSAEWYLDDRETPATLILTFDVSGLTTPGTYNATVSVSSPDAPLPVVIDVELIFSITYAHSIIGDVTIVIGEGPVAVITGDDYIYSRTAPYVGSGVARPPATIAAYRWEQISGHTVEFSSLTDASISIFFPTIHDGDVFVIRLRVTDSDGKHGYATKTITVGCMPFSDEIVGTLTPSYETATAAVYADEVETAAVYAEDADPLIACDVVAS
jgi:hypothetical protein